LLDVYEHEVLVSSTGIIGKPLPVNNIIKGVYNARKELSKNGSILAAEAIKTTDKCTKEIAVELMIDHKTVKIGGIAKGSGMIAPNMATMLAFITTDANVSSELLQYFLKKAVERTFNRISVDGDMSTNDMVVAMANGMAGNKELYNTNDPDYRIFYEALEFVLLRLSKMIVIDGEGATKFIEVRINGAATENNALKAAKAISNSNLVKTAMYGEDANWGRILAAIGYSGIEFKPENVEIYFDNLQILSKNYGAGFCEDKARKILMGKEIKLTVDLNQGYKTATYMTCDLSKDYVDINANYRT